MLARAGIFITLIFCSFNLYAQVVQVPEACAGEKTPCLIRTENNYFEFAHKNLKIKMNPDTLLKIEFDEKNDRIYVLEGRVALNSQNSGKDVFLHGQKIINGLYMVSRYDSTLKALNLDTFIYDQYRTDRSEAELVKTVFADKVTLVDFSKDYFTDINQYKKFLQSVEPKWKIEFEKNNNDQTKVLLRSIASEEAKLKKEAEAKSKELRQQKKVRDQFFYRTFYR